MNKSNFLNALIMYSALSLFSNDVFAFAIGAINGVTCGGQISCTVKNLIPQYQRVHQQITVNALLNNNFSLNIDGAPFGFSIELVHEIADANASTDKDQRAFLHFDNEQFAAAIQFLIATQSNITNQLNQSDVISLDQARNIRNLLGNYLHTLQDFFSHSTWVNNHQAKSSDDHPPVPPFWDANSISLPTVTKSPCPFFIKTSGVASDFDTTTIDGNSFTSGYAIGTGSSLDLAIAPTGKCAHGLAGITTDNLGIHKDWESRYLHKEAKEQAQYATAQAVQYILDKVTNKDNVCMILTNKACKQLYTLNKSSGICVDDDVTVYVNDKLIYQDTDHVYSCSPPLQFEAKVGDSIRVVGINWFLDCEGISLINITRDSDGKSQTLSSGVPEICDSKPGDGYVFFDQTFQVPAF